MTAILDKYLDLLQHKRAFAALATLMPDGSPQVTPVWFDYTAGFVRVNTAKGRVKARNLKPGSAVALAIMIPMTPIAISRSAAAWGVLSKKGPTRISTRWPRNISARKSIRFAKPAKCASCTKSNRSPH